MTSGTIATGSPWASDPALARSIRRRAWQERALGWGLIAAILLVWESFFRLGWINPLFTSAPSLIGRAAGDMIADGSLIPHLAISAAEFLMGFGCAAAIGVSLGAAVGLVWWIRAALDPIVAALYAMPRVAIFPLIVIWFGIGLESKIFLIALMCTLPILVNTAAAMRTVQPDLIDVARSFGAGPWQRFATVLLPSAVPFILSSLRLAVAQALVGVTVAEMYASKAGIGYLIAASAATFRTDRVMVGVLILAMAGVSLTKMIHSIERQFDRWRRTSSNERELR